MTNSVEKTTAQKTPATVLDVFKSDSFREQIAAALPAHIPAETMMRIALTDVRTNELLQKCTPASFMGALLKAAQCGLRPGMFGECYLIPRWSSRLKSYEASFQPGYQGLVQLAHNSGYVDSIGVHAVYRQDDFSYQRGTSPSIHHAPSASGEMREEDITHFYAVVNLKTGGQQFEVLTRAEVDHVRDTFAATKSKDTGKISGPWATSYAEMGKKTALLRALKLVPKDSDRLALAMQGSGCQPAQRDLPSSYPAKSVAERVSEKVGVDTVTGELIEAEATEEAMA